MRMKIKISTVEDAMRFVGKLNDEIADDALYSIENTTGHYRCNARSIVGIFYAMTEFDEMWFKDETNNGIPNIVMEYAI